MSLPRKRNASFFYRTQTGIEVKEEVTRLHSESDYAETREGATDTDGIYEVDIN